MARSGEELCASLEQHGFGFFAGVPCSLMADLIATMEAHPRLPYIATPRHDVAHTPHDVRDRLGSVVRAGAL